MGTTKNSLVFLLTSRIYLINKVTVTDQNAQRKKKKKAGIDFDFIHGVHGKREDQHTEKVKSLTKNM